MLPLLREQDGSEGSKTSTAEERVIGAGLKALGQNADGAAVKELFHMCRKILFQCGACHKVWHRDPWVHF